MKFKILLSSALVVATLSGSAQNRNLTYAITGDGNNDFLWMNIRQVDLTTGKITKTVFDRSQTSYQLTDVTNRNTPVVLNANGNIGAREYPTVSLVASAAYDSRSNKIFFTPMRLGELRWLDLDARGDQPQFYTIKPEVLTSLGNPADEANNITRMVIGADGNGYALTNDANHLFRFSTGRVPVMIDMGNIVDAESNPISIKSRCSCWGGDMIADAFGMLYVITANHHVFVIDPATRVATYKGAISGLPAAFTTNAAAVGENDNIVVGSANTFEAYYQLKISDLAAVKIEGSDGKYNASDFANGNLLFQKQADAVHTNTVDQNLVPVTKVGEAKIFPNPVTNYNFNVLFDNKTSGVYTILLTDLAGRVLQSNEVTVTKGMQTENIIIRSRSAKGMLMVKVLDDQKQSVATEKIIIQ